MHRYEALPSLMYTFSQSSPTYYCAPSSCPSEPLKKLEEHGLRPFTVPPVPSYLKSETEPAQTKDGDIPFIPSGGLTRRMLQSLGPDWPIPTFALLHFVFEGDNRGDAGMLVALVNEVFELKLQRKLCLCVFHFLTYVQKSRSQRAGKRDCLVPVMTVVCLVNGDVMILKAGYRNLVDRVTNLCDHSERNVCVVGGNHYQK